MRPGILTEPPHQVLNTKSRLYAQKHPEDVFGSGNPTGQTSDRFSGQTSDRSAAQSDRNGSAARGASGASPFERVYHGRGDIAGFPTPHTRPSRLRASPPKLSKLQAYPRCGLGAAGSDAVSELFCGNLPHEIFRNSR